MPGDDYQIDTDELELQADPDLEELDDAEEPKVQADAPQYVTRDDMKAFQDQLLAALRPAPVEKEAEVPDLNWDDEILSKADQRAEQKFFELNKHTFAKDILAQTTAGMPEDVVNEMRGTLMKLDGRSLANTINNPQLMKEIRRQALGINEEIKEAAAPRTSSRGTVGAETSEEAKYAREQFEKWKHVPGYTKETAKQEARKRYGN